MARKSATPLSKAAEREELAALLAQSRSALARAGRALHDEVGPHLSGAGMLLSIVRADFPAADEELLEVFNALEQAMERVRSLSQELNTSPVDRVGLPHALSRLAGKHPQVEVRFTATAKLPRADASALYDAAVAAVHAALAGGASKIRVAASGTRGVKIRVTDNGSPRGRARSLALPRLLAAQTGIELAISTGKSTIVSITYAGRRTAG